MTAAPTAGPVRVVSSAVRSGRCTALVLAAACFVLAAAAGAHTRSVSYSSWRFDATGAQVHVRVPLLELSRLGLDPSLDMGSGGAAARYLADHLSLRSGGAACALREPPAAETAPDGFVHVRWHLDCGAADADASALPAATIESRILLAEAPSHLHFARVARGGGSALERVLTESEPAWTLPGTGEGEGQGDDARGTTLPGYLLLGVEHILSGWDHLAFVLALLLLARRLGEVAGLVTAFTVAHSVTLGLAVLGWVDPEAGAVEALIGFSIALVAAENAWLLAGRGRAVPAATTLALLGLAALAAAGTGAVSPLTLVGLALFCACHFALLDRVERPARLRAAVAFAFGLVHGFGFAGVLAEMQLPTDRVVPALFGFNLGVELGQLAVVCVVWPALHQLARRSPLRGYRALAEVGSAAICGLGLFWFLGRLLR